MIKRKGRIKAGKTNILPGDRGVPEEVDVQISLELVTRALSEIDEGVLVADGNLHVLYLNNAVVQIFGLSPGGWYGLTFIEIIRDHECDSLLRKSINTRQPQSALISTHQKKQLLSISVVPSTDDNYIVVIRDLTERQKMEQIRRDFVTNVAHEFRTPIASIRLLVETLMQGAMNDAEVSTDFLHKMHVESIKLQHMTDDLFQLFKAEGGKLINERSTVDIEQLINQTIARLQEQANQKQIVVKSYIENGMEKPVIDRNGVESVLMNLLHNAIKYTPANGEIRVQAKKEDGVILIAVTDTGIGIPADEFSRVFERFYKVDKARDTEGSGLGLAISKHIIVSHGGRIWVESIEGRGSTFFFTLPLGH